MLRHQKKFTRDELLRLLGEPSHEGNGAERRWVDAEGGFHIESRAVGYKQPPAPPIPGVDRWLAWDCFDNYPRTQDQRTRLLAIFESTEQMDPEEAKSFVGELRTVLDSLGEGCQASTKQTFGFPADGWYMDKICSKHREVLGA